MSLRTVVSPIELSSVGTRRPRLARSRHDRDAARPHRLPASVEITNLHRLEPVDAACAGRRGGCRTDDQGQRYKRRHHRQDRPPWPAPAASLSRPGAHSRSLDRTRHHHLSMNEGDDGRLPRQPTHQCARRPVGSRSAPDGSSSIRPTATDAVRRRPDGVEAADSCPLQDGRQPIGSVGELASGDGAGRLMRQLPLLSASARLCGELTDARTDELHRLRRTRHGTVALPEPPGRADYSLSGS